MSTAKPRQPFAAALVVAVLVCGGLALGATTATARALAPHAPGAVLVGFKPGVSATRRSVIQDGASLGPRSRTLLSSSRIAAAGPRVRRLGPIVLLPVRRGSELGVAQRLSRLAEVRFAEPDYLMREDAVPNDPGFGLQWGFRNTGQVVNGTTGVGGADERTVSAWDVQTGSRSVVIGEVDSGVDYTHPDLNANVWKNPGGVGGCTAGTRGYNVVAGTCDPRDDEITYGGHGTHVAGILGAVGNNGTGVTGVNWATTILPVKWLDSSGWGDTSELLSALDWLLQAKQAGVNVRVVHDSATFVGTASSQALSDEIDVLGANDILFVTAAGNTGDNNDNLAVRRYPCGYDRPTEICVTASDQRDRLPSWANYGATTVDLAAPGDNVYSTLRNGTYGYVSGGSMASPQVAGAAALILAAGNQTTSALRSRILANVDPLPSLSGLVRTGGRLNVCKALPGCSAAVPSTFGKATVGASSDTFGADRKRVNRYSLTQAGSVSKLSVYLAPTGSAGQQLVRGVIYGDAAGSPGSLLATSAPLTFTSTGAAGWYDLSLPSALSLPAGNYWIGVITGASSGIAGFRYDSVSASRAYNLNPYTSGPSDPFGTASIDSEQMSLYATYTPSSGSATVPANTAPPVITGTAGVGQTLSSTTGTWSGSPTRYDYQWSRCNTSGASCVAIAGASAQTYAPVAADVGSTLRAIVTASNGAGSASASSTQTATVQAAATRFGKTTVGASSDRFSADRKRVNRYSLGTAGQVTSLSVYLAPTTIAGQQLLRGVIYTDAAGAPSRLLATTSALTFHSTDPAGWYALPLATSLSLAPGNYWIGVIAGARSNVAGLRSDSGAFLFSNANSYLAGATDPFGTASVDNQQISLYATYTP